MSKKESVKSYIDMLRTLLAIIITAIFGVLGYGIIHIDNLSKNQAIGGVIAFIALVTALIIIVKKFLIKNKELEEMQ